MRKSYSAGSRTVGEDGAPELVDAALAFAQVGHLEPGLEDCLRPFGVAGTVGRPRLRAAAAGRARGSRR